MVLMVLDHALFYFMDPSVTPVNLSPHSWTTPGIFLAEWMTHFCAPVFFLLAGVGTYLQVARGATKEEVAKYLLIRGVLLVLLDMTAVQWALYYRFDFSSFVMSSDGEIERMFLFTPLVLWGLGLSMIVMAGLIWLPTVAVSLLGGAMILLHNLLDKADVNHGLWQWLWLARHPQANWALSKHITIAVDFSLIPWVGVMAAGYGLGALFLLPRPRRRAMLLCLGGTCCVAFLVLRTFHLYGDPHPRSGRNVEPPAAYKTSPVQQEAEPEDLFAGPAGWGPEDRDLFSLLSFINCEKYPASLQFLLMTLGPALILLAALDREPRTDGKNHFADWLLQPFKFFGRVPLFFYLGQWFVLHFLALALAWAEHRPTHWLFRTYNGGFPGWDPNANMGLGGTYFAWLVCVLILYPACVWFARLKDRHRDSWLRYF